MPEDLSPTELREKHIRVLGSELGAAYNVLFNEVAWTHQKWRQFVTLYGDNQERVDLINRAAGMFFKVVQDALFYDTLLEVAKLTDPPVSVGKRNLSVRSLPGLVDDATIRARVEAAAADALTASKFARDWRNRRLAHRDFALATRGQAAPLENATRNGVEAALRAVDRVLNIIAYSYFKEEVQFDMPADAGSALSLLYVIRDGLEAEDALLRRIRAGTSTEEDRRRKPDI